MDSLISFVLTPGQFLALQDKYGFQPEDMETFPDEHANFIDPLEDKIPICVKHFNIGYHLLTLGFFRDVLHHRKVHINQFVPNGLNKVVAFKMLYQTNGINPNI